MAGHIALLLLNRSALLELSEFWMHSLHVAFAWIGLLDFLHVFFFFPLLFGLLTRFLLFNLRLPFVEVGLLCVPTLLG